MAAAILEDELSAELARLMDEGRSTRPPGVAAATLLYDGSLGHLVAVWQSRDVLDAYVAETDVPRGLELMRKVGVSRA